MFRLVPWISLCMVRSSASHCCLKRVASCFSSAEVNASISAVWLDSRCCRRSVKLAVIRPSLLVDPALHAEFLAALRVLDGEVILALPGNLQSRLLQGGNHAVAVRHLLRRYKGRQIGVDALPALAQPETLVGPLRRSVKLCGPVRVVGTRPALGPVQRVPERRIGPFPAGGRDVERLAGGQLHAGRHEVKFDPPAFGVLMPHPGDVVLLRVHARKGQTLEGVHGLLLLGLAGAILQGEGQDAVGIAPLALDAVDQVTGPVHVAPHHLGRRMAPPLAVVGGQVGRDLAPTAAASPGELNQHRQAARALSAERKAPGRSRSAASRAPQPAPDAGGSKHGRSG